ncbi:MAG: hypothetical protein ACR2GY_11360 [Phycisphaerales bacterium]
MTTSLSRVTLLAAVSFLLLSGVGCEDEANQQLSQKNDALQTVSRDYTTALTSEQPGRGLADMFTTSTPSAALVEASVLRDSADIALSKLEQMEAQSEADRQQLITLLGAAMRAEALAATHGRFNDSVDRSTIEQERMTTESALRDVNAQQQQLTEPIQRLTSKNQTDQIEVNRLREESARLRDQAFDMGELEGFGPIQQAVAIDRQADAIEARIAQNNIELMDLQAQMALADAREQQFQIRAAGVNGAAQSMDDSSQQHTSAAGLIREANADIQRQFTEAWDQVKAKDAERARMYGEVSATLERAMSLCDQAGSQGPSGNATQVLKARLQQMHGHTQSLRARSLQSDATLLALLAQSGDAVSQAAGASGKLAAANKALTDTTSAAKAAYTAASETLNSVSGANDRDVAILKAQLAAAAQGVEADLSSFATDDQASNAGAGNTTSSTGGQMGASSPEDLVQRLNDAQSAPSFAQMGTMFNLTDFSQADPALAQMMEAMRETINATWRLDAALQEKFGRGVEDMAGAAAGMAGMPEDILPTNIRLDGVSGSSGTITSTNHGSQTIVERNGRWYIAVQDSDGSGFFEGMGGGGGDPEEVKMFMQMFLPVLQKSAHMTDDHAAKVRSGEFTSFEAVEQSLQAEGEKLAEEMFGGMGMPGGN